MSKIIDYKLVLCNEVKEELKNKWEPYGIPFSLKKDTVGYEQAFQAMILREKDMKCIKGEHYFSPNEEELTNPQYYNEILKVICKNCGISNIEYMKSIGFNIDTSPPDAISYCYEINE